MKTNNTLKLALLCVLFAVQCKNTAQKSSLEIEKQLFYFKTTECMGTCPVFTFTVYANGTCSYQGIANVDKMGDFSGTLSTVQLNELKTELSSSDFFNIEVNNNTLVKDLPTQYLYYDNGEREKIIMYYHPKNKNVDVLIEFAYRLIGDVEWKNK